MCFKSGRSHEKSGRGEVAWLAYRPVEPGARVRIPASALTTLQVLWKLLFWEEVQQKCGLPKNEDAQAESKPKQVNAA